MADVVIFGATMSAQVVHAYLMRHSDHRIVGFTADAAYAKSDRFVGLPLVPWQRLEEAFPPTQVQLLGPISYRRVNEFRRDRYIEGKTRGYRFASFIHPASIVDAERIGDHCLILAGSVVEPYATIGDNVIVWGGSHVAHHCAIGDHCFISGKVGISGGTRLGERCFVGGGCIVSEGLTIGEGSLLSFGAVVTKNIPPGAIVRRAGKVSISPIPAARIRDRL